MKPVISIENTVTMGQLLEFEVAFPGEKRQAIEKYLSGGSRSVILNAAAFFLGFKSHKSKFLNNKQFFEMFFREENKAFANQVYERIRMIESTGVQIGITHTYSSLKLFECYFSKPEEPETQTPQEFEVNLFKAYLVLNSEYINIQKIAFASTKELEENLHMPMMMFCLQYPVLDKSNYDINQIWATQMIKGIYLFQFLESHEKTKPLLKAFLIHFQCDTWKEYLKRLIPLTFSAITDEREAHTDLIVKASDQFEADCLFIEKLIIQEQDELDPNDFLGIRAKPFYKIKDGVYRIIFKLFAVEKIFKGAYFLLRDVNKTLPNDKRIKEIKSFYGEEFSEKILCYKAMESVYPDKCIRFSGTQLTDMKINAAPDYYIRKGKNIILVESKDFLIAADKKMSFDFGVYENEFGRVLDYEELPNGKIKPKAVMQLINNIRKVLKKEILVDVDYHYKDVYVYPILLTHDHQYDTPGFNELIDYWFQEELLELGQEKLFTHRVKPISVVNIDSILYNQIGLEKNIALHEILNLYQENKKVVKSNKKIKSKEEYEKFMEEYKQMRMDKLIPFSVFINKYFYKQGFWKSPPILDLVAPLLFSEEYKKRKESNPQ